MTIGENIRQMRESKGYSRGKLSIRSKVSVPVIANWEKNRALPSLLALISVADVLNVSLDELIGRGIERLNEQ